MNTEPNYASNKTEDVKNFDPAKKEHSMSQIPITDSTKLLDVLAEEFED